MRFRTGTTSAPLRSAFAILAALVALLAAAHAWAQPARDRPAPGAYSERPLLPERAEVLEKDFWVVGVGIERGIVRLTDNPADELRLGVQLSYRNRVWGPHAWLQAGPDSGTRLENLSAAVGAGIRAHFLLWEQAFSYGVSVQLETRFRRSFWLAMATPLELGTVLWSRGSAEISVFSGMRRVFAGELVNSFLLDPNGFDNQDRADELTDIKRNSAWQGFIAVTFARRL